MNITYRINGEFLYILLDGRIDASNANDVEKRIFEIREENQNKKTIIDADLLTYISSAGLRIILKLKKVEPEISIINVCPEVYDIFDMTGFAEMIKIEKAYRKMSVEGCRFIAKGAKGAVYRYDDETIIKVYFSKNSLPEIEQERINARKAFVLGINTAIPYGIVRIGDGYGTVTELLNATSVSKLIIDNPNDLTVPVNYFVDMLKTIHSTVAEDDKLPKCKNNILGWLKFIEQYLPEEVNEKLLKLVNSIPDSNNMIHCDYHTNNVMVQNGESILIDMDTLSVGHPIFELGFMHNAFIGFYDVIKENALKFLGYPYEVSERFWNLTLEKYFDTNDQEYLNLVQKKIQVISYIRLFSRSIRHVEEQHREESLKVYKNKLIELCKEIDTLEF